MPDRAPLDALARLYGVQMEYLDTEGKLRRAPDETAVAVLVALGAPVRTAEDADDALRARRQELWRRVLPAVSLTTPGGGELLLRLPAAQAGSAGVTLEVNHEERRHWAIALDELPVARRALIDGAAYISRRLALPGGLPLGYHTLQLELADRTHESLILVPPPLAYQGRLGDQRPWGLVAPTYALRRRDGFGSDLGDLDAAVQWAARHGSGAFGTLPLLAELWELGDGPEPYRPTTRLFWNEFYLDVQALPHLSHATAARRLLERFAPHIRTLCDAPLVDYASVVALKRQVVAAMAEWYFAGSDHSELAEYVRGHELATQFARFRAAGQRHHTHWPDWPRPAADGDVRREGYDQPDYRYYLYSQWQCEQQLTGVADRARTAGAPLYMDLPLSVRHDGFDTWRHRDLFVDGVDIGSPPDPFSPGGQNWALAPIHPHRQREGGYRYFIGCLRHHLCHAPMLRLDHVMGLHRQFWIPRGMETADGIYVRYPSGELLAVLTLESCRHKALIVGENLGTVPAVVNRKMRRHGILSMYVLPLEIDPDHTPSVGAPATDAAASLNTHDMATFAAFWEDLDIEEKESLGLFPPHQVSALRARRDRQRQALLGHLRRQRLLAGGPAAAEDVLKACLTMLAESPARLVLVNLEDLWGETASQNTPGAPASYPNWRRKARYRLEEFQSMPQVDDLLSVLDRLRRARPRPSVEAS